MVPNQQGQPQAPAQPANNLPPAAPQAPQPAAIAPAPASGGLPPSLLDKPAQPARIQLTGGRLTVAAENSSLTDILHQLSSTSGMTIDGLDKDTRVFGTYGPGDPREILNQLLDGAGYNVMMVGGTTAGTPRRLLLTARSNAPITQVASAPSEPEDDQDDNVPLNNYPPAGEIQPHPPMPPQQPQQPGQNPNGGVRSPQQMLQEMMQQRQMQQQQQQQQQQNPQ